MSMAVVALIPTGAMEHRCLHLALRRVFPDHHFMPIPPEQHLDGFTSHDVASLAEMKPGPVPSNLTELAAQLVNSIFPGRKGQKIDFAYVVEDLELCNQHQPDRVLSCFRDAVRSYIEETWPQQTAARYKEVRERCSFHLFRPMTEAYFFGEAAALSRANVIRLPQLPTDLDLEQFRTTDQVYLGLPQGTKPLADMPERELHPKSYLRYLCNPSLADRSRRYKETVNGVNALSSLDLQQVLRSPPHCPFLHALFDDLAEALNCPLPFVRLDSRRPPSAIPGHEEPNPAESVIGFGDLPSERCHFQSSKTSHERLADSVDYTPASSPAIVLGVRLGAAASAASSIERFVAARTASIKAPRTPPRSSACNPAIVVPPGEAT